MRKPRSRRFKALLAACGLLAGVFNATLLATTASAGSDGCASWSGIQAVTVKNNCTYTIRRKIIWSWAKDTPCYSLGPGTTNTFFKPISIAKFDTVVAC